MKKILIILLAVILSFAGISSISASDNLIKTDTKDKVIFIQDENGRFSYSWSFDKEEYKKNAFDFDMTIGFNSPFKNDIEKLISKDVKKEYVSFNYHGNLPSTATIKIPVRKFKDEQILNLYYYDDETNKIELVQNNIVVSNGYVTFDINHCSDYFLTMSIVKEANGNNNNGVIIVGMIIVIVGLVGYTLLKNKK